MILEIGSGTDRTYRFLPKTPIIDETIFVDIEKPKRKLATFVQADAHCLPFIDSAFSSVYASHVMEHLRNPGLFLDEVNRILNGELHIWVPNFSMRTATWDPSHRQIFTYFSFKEILVSRGFITDVHLETWILNFRFFPRIISQTLAIIAAQELYGIGRALKVAEDKSELERASKLKMV